MYFPRRLPVRFRGVHWQDMTALASVFTLGGFVVGADGRRMEFTGRKIVTDSACKIYCAKAKKTMLAYGWVGATSFFSGGTLRFDMLDESRRIQSDLSTSDFKHLSVYTAAFKDMMFSAMLERIGSKDASIALLPDGRIASVFFAGYVNGTPAMGEAEFRHTNGTLLPPVLVEVLESPKVFKIVSGSIAVHDAMVDAGVMVPPVTLADGAELIRRYVQTCVDNNGSCHECSDIGGHVHVATVTPQGFEWKISPLEY